MKNEKLVAVHLTKTQCEAVAEFIELNLLDVIRGDQEIDNLLWVESLLIAKNAFEQAAKGDG